VFPAHGRLPTNLDEVNEREKDIRYASRTMFTTDTLREKHDVRHAINELHKLLPPEFANTAQAKRLYEHGCVTVMEARRWKARSKDDPKRTSALLPFRTAPYRHVQSREQAEACKYDDEPEDQDPEKWLGDKPD
jgi:hypothetical protein